ncbi:type IV secretory pathway TrbL component [Sphingobacterium soli]|nr:type IV secretory pathway TrbL component [Sphingobacterium soli]
MEGYKKVLGELSIFKSEFYDIFSKKYFSISNNVLFRYLILAIRFVFYLPSLLIFLILNLIVFLFQISLRKLFLWVLYLRKPHSGEKKLIEFILFGTLLFISLIASVLGVGKCYRRKLIWISNQ